LLILGKEASHEIPVAVTILALATVLAFLLQQGLYLLPNLGAGFLFDEVWCHDGQRLVASQRLEPIFGPNAWERNTMR
jgi:hypothetical protein